MQRRADPLPSARDATKPYRMQAIKYGPYFRLTIDGMVVIDKRQRSKPFFLTLSNYRLVENVDAAIRHTIRVILHSLLAYFSANNCTAKAP